MRDAIEEASHRIRDRVRVTPVVGVEGRAFGQSGEVLLKLESLQHTGSFKPRGAFNRMLSVDIPPAGVIAASGGNHGAAVAYAARELGADAEIFVPQTTPELKVARLRNHGVKVRLTGRDYAEAFSAMQERAMQTNALVVHAYDEQAVVVGQGTLARELEAQVNGIDAVFVAVGGGGLIGGISAWFEGRVNVIGVEPSSCPTLYSALKAGEPVDVPISGIAADSLGAKRVGSIAFSVAQQYASDVVLVSDDEILTAQRFLWERLRIAAEAGGATALAGFLSGRGGVVQDARVAIIVCGGNVDPRVLSSVS